MSDYYDDDTDLDADGPAGLRAALKKAQAAAKAAEKRAEEAEERAHKAESVAKKSSLADLLEAAGVPKKFASRADKDGAEATEDGVKAWIEENRDFYNFGQVATPQAEAETDGEPNVSPDLAAAVQASQALDASGVTPSEVDIVNKIQSISTDATSEDQILNEIRSLGVGVGIN